jgi:superfamily I DNA and/or RNA helicase
MKKIIFLCLAAVFSTGIFATPIPATVADASAKILKLFHVDFPEISNHTIHKTGDVYMVSFKDAINNYSCKVFYDSNGNMLQTIRYYSDEELAPFIRAKVHSKYQGKKIMNVTELINDNEHFYQMILEDNKSLFVVHSDDKGMMYTEKKFKKAK